MFLTVHFLLTTLPQKYIIESMLNDHTPFFYVFTSCHISFKSETFVIALLTFFFTGFCYSLAFLYFGDTMLSQSLINFSKNLKCNIICIKNDYKKCELSQKIRTANQIFKAEQTRTSIIPYFFQWRLLTLL